jgi:biotin-dependent carboxylase-like uncharacterized protein
MTDPADPADPVPDPPSAVGTAVLEVVSPGLLTTVQDFGRPGLESMGVPRGGAADPLGLAVANLVVGNEPGAAAIECTILGPELRVLLDVTIGLGGADLGAHALPSGRALQAGASHKLRAGEVLAFGDAEPEIGCRAYLAVAGGIDVPEVLGSRSTSLVGGFGGFDGRPLRAGDRLRARGGMPGPAQPEWPPDLPLPSFSAPVRVLTGPDAAGSAADDAAGSTPALTDLLVGAWTVSHASDRRGLRLEGSALATPGEVADRPSQAVLPGAIQLTPSGQPIVLMPDAGPTGGYPVIAVVCSADLWLLGQLRPGSEVAFQLVHAAMARRAIEDHRRLLSTAAQQLAAPLS